MTHRIISAEVQPEFVFQHVQQCGCLCRVEATEYRGPVAFIGDGRVWAVAELRDVKPATQGKPAKDGTPCPQGYHWCFESVCVVEEIPCAVVAAPAMFENAGQWEPLFLQASAQAALNRLLSPETGLEEPQKDEMAQLPVETVEPSFMRLCPCESKQMEMF